MKQLGFFLSFSVIFHFLLSFTLLYFAERLPRDSKPEVTQIEIMEEPPKAPLNERIEKTRQLIKQLQNTAKQIQDPKLRARFESEKTQRVEKETKAANLGLSRNSMPSLPSPSTAASTTEKTANTDPQLPGPARQQMRAMPVTPPSAVSSILPGDIQNSNATNLNTDANVYYSFYNRVEELFYIRWVERVRYYWDRTDPNYKKNVLAGKVWSTQIEVWLKATGEFDSAYIKQRSGYQPFDEATVYAFKDAKFFPNPPRAKVEPDGFVRLRYRFSVYVDAY